MTSDDATMRKTKRQKSSSHLCRSWPRTTVWGSAGSKPHATAHQRMCGSEGPAGSIGYSRRQSCPSHSSHESGGNNQEGQLQLSYPRGWNPQVQPPWRSHAPRMGSKLEKPTRASVKQLMLWMWVRQPSLEKPRVLSAWQDLQSLQDRGTLRIGLPEEVIRPR